MNKEQGVLNEEGS